MVRLTQVLTDGGLGTSSQACETYCTFTTEEPDMNNWTDELCYYDLCSDAAPNEWNDCLDDVDTTESSYKYG